MLASGYSCDMPLINPKAALLLPVLLATAASRAAEAAPDWTYDKDKTGQEEWGFLHKDYAACDEGLAQSPINIAFTEKASLPLEIKYAATPSSIRRANHTIEISITGEALLYDNKTPYRLKLIQFHSPSEHTVLGDYAPLEIHFVHEGFDNSLLILAVFAQPGEQPLKPLQNILGHIPRTEDTSAETTFNLPGILPAKRSYYAYRGSLTYPPCTEGVEWRILKDPIFISKGQIADFGKILNRNRRKTQPVYMRKVLESQ